MNPAFVRALYNLALPPFLLAALPGSLLKMKRRGGGVRDFGQRLGLYRRETLARVAAMEKPWWIHAVSVGEVLVAAKLIAEIRRQSPSTPLLLTTTTSTGHAVARRELPPEVPVFYNPADLPMAVERALDAFRPGRLILVEAEIWPNLLHAAKAWGVPVSLVNARLSPRSERRFRAARGIVGPIFAQLDHAFVPEPEDVDRWAALGVRPQTLTATGSLKHDYEGLADDPRRADFDALLGTVWPGPRPPLLLAASTHPGEEAALARVFLRLREKIPALRLMAAPRHVERRAAVEAELRALGLSVLRRSSLNKTAAAPPLALAESAPPDVFLIDTTGELRAWQPLADAVVIGKSFLSEGGQNPVEALMAGRPVAAGPHMENFGPLMETLLRHQGIIQVPGLDALPAALLPLFQDKTAAAALARRAQNALSPHQGATRRTAQALLESHTMHI